jgi:mono/diheme cytochrome c family protein
MNKLLLFAVILVFSAFLLIDKSGWLESKRMARTGLFPELNYKPNISQGKAEYQKACVECHGAGLLGSEKGPSLLDSTYKDSHHADLSFYYAVKSGVRQHHWRFGDMPKIAGLSPERVSDIIAYVRHKQKLSNIK